MRQPPGYTVQKITDLSVSRLFFWCFPLWPFASVFMVFLPTLGFFAHASLDLHLSFSSVRGWGGGMGGGGGGGGDRQPCPKAPHCKTLTLAGYDLSKRNTYTPGQGEQSIQRKPARRAAVAEALGRVQCMQLSRVASNHMDKNKKLLV